MFTASYRSRSISELVKGVTIVHSIIDLQLLQTSGFLMYLRNHGTPREADYLIRL
jgi:hypothetical protein